MAQFKLAEFTEGRVMASSWWTPKPGQRVELYRQDGNLIVGLSDRDVPAGTIYAGNVLVYTWPKACESHQEAGRLAIRYFERKTGLDALGFSDD